MFGMDWDAPLSNEDRDDIIDKIAAEVTKRGMTVPAVLFLEMHKPLGFLAGQSLIVGAGFIAPLVGPKNLQHWAKLIENPDDVERLIRRIETLRTSETPPKLKTKPVSATTESQA